MHLAVGQREPHGARHTPRDERLAEFRHPVPVFTIAAGVAHDSMFGNFVRFDEQLAVDLLIHPRLKHDHVILSLERPRSYRIGEAHALAEVQVPHPHGQQGLRAVKRLRDGGLAGGIEGNDGYAVGGTADALALVVDEMGVGLDDAVGMEHEEQVALDGVFLVVDGAAAAQ